MSLSLSPRGEYVQIQQVVPPSLRYEVPASLRAVVSGVTEGGRLSELDRRVHSNNPFGECAFLREFNDMGRTGKLRLDVASQVLSPSGLSTACQSVLQPQEIAFRASQQQTVSVDEDLAKPAGLGSCRDLVGTPPTGLSRLAGVRRKILVPEDHSEESSDRG